MTLVRTQPKAAKRKFVRILWSSLGILGGCTAAPDYAFGRDTQFHASLGYLSASYTGPVQGKVTTPGAINLEYEIFETNRRSFLLRTTLGMDLSSSTIKYNYTGVGMRFYLTKGMSFDSITTGASIVSIPVLRYYGGFDTGLSQVIVKTYNAILQSGSQMLEVGVNGGAIYQVGSRTGIEVNTGLSYGYGFSSIAVSGLVLRITTGICVFF